MGRTSNARTVCLVCLVCLTCLVCRSAMAKEKPKATLDKTVENLENVERIQNIQGAQRAKGIQTAKGVRNAQSVQSVEGVQGVQPSQPGQASQNASDAQSIQSNERVKAESIAESLRERVGSDTYSLGNRRRGGPPIQEESTKESRALPQAAIQRVIRTHKDEVWHCFERTAKLDSSSDRAERSPSSVTVTLSFSVEPTGNVSSVAVIPEALPATSFGVMPEAGKNQRLVRCLVATVKGWQFPEAEEASQARHTFTLGKTDARSR
ncbi:MAG: hypothetical protein V2A73_00520 [Pseudomonadota bacterium]